MPHPIPKIAAIHDLAGYSRVSLTAITPVLTSMGFQVCPLPTALLSTHTQYSRFTFLDLTEEMPKIIHHWKELQVQFEAIYSGFLGSQRQVEIVMDFIDTFGENKPLIVVDPVMGDNGKLYTSMTEEMVVEMRKLIRKANVITPNLTELFFLLGKPYKESPCEAEIKDYLLELSQMGPETVVITSVPVEGKAHITSSCAYTRSTQKFWRVQCPYIPAHYPGTGDTFTSVLTGSLLQGDSLPIALDRSVQFISMGIRATFGHEYDNLEGILLEKMLPILRIPVQISSYEWI